jgi:hypothetical protein
MASVLLVAIACAYAIRQGIAVSFPLADLPTEKGYCEEFGTHAMATSKPEGHGLSKIIHRRNF